MQYNEGQYGKALDSSEAVSLPVHWSCWCCGNYVEGATPARQIHNDEVVRSIKQPLKNKVIKGSIVRGLVKTVVQEHFASISQMLKNNWSWHAISRKLSDMYPDYNFDYRSVANAYNRLRKEKGCA